MRAIRSVLWIGPATGLAASGLLECPTLDATWVPDVGEALALPPSCFDAEIVEGFQPEQLADGVRRLRSGTRRSPVIARLPEADASCEAIVLAAGADAVLLVRETEGETSGRQELLTHIDRCAEGQAWSDPADEPQQPEPALPGMVGRSDAIQDVMTLVHRASRSMATVLISGETGTGKEVIARGLHATGPRASRRFVAVNCAAFPDALLESELFGHVRGAFTGADTDKTGLFAEANGGSIFLDEIGETSAPLQARLLRVLQEREVRPVGSVRSRRVDVRVIAATNRPLRDDAVGGLFREDLYYRLAVFPLTVPPLRHRKDDILPLAEHFLALHGKRERKRGCRLSRPTAHLLLAYDWPGNVRELENEMQRVLALCEPGALITPRQLSDTVKNILEPITTNTRAGDTLRNNMNRIESWMIRRSLESNGGRRTATARKLGITREGLYK
jgi:transcriptional regulator with PAS, ATPase and Fis domain